MTHFREKGNVSRFGLAAGVRQQGVPPCRLQHILSLLRGLLSIVLWAIFISLQSHFLIRLYCLPPPRFFCALDILNPIFL